jgi:hypothetical protein
MTSLMYAASAPVFIRHLGNLISLLDKARAHAEEKKFSPDAYLSSRFAPDMLPFTKQVQIAADNAKGCVARLAGIEAPKFADDETTLEQLKARLQKTIDFVKSVPAEAFAGAEERPIELPLPHGEPLKMNGQVYLNGFALPNFYFHVTATYLLLREAGVAIGKRDFIGNFMG